jgi:hypothetical protein
VKNPNPIARAGRLQRRRKELGISPSCFDCGESDIACLELDHQVGRKRDPEFTRIRCRNCHRKVEFKRDVAGLTKNGQHRTEESPVEEERSYLLLVAEDLDSIVELINARSISRSALVAALQASTASIRRRAKSLTQLDSSDSSAAVSTSESNPRTSQSPS